MFLSFPVQPRVPRGSFAPLTCEMVDAGRAPGHNRSIAQSCRRHFYSPFLVGMGPRGPPSIARRKQRTN
jgi:hypothetical protein